MKKGLKILLGVLLVIILAAAGIVIWQWDNLNALKYGMTMTPEEVQEQLETNQKQLKDAMEEYQIPQEEIGEELLSQLLAGDVTILDTVQRILHREISVEAMDSSPLFGAPISKEGKKTTQTGADGRTPSEQENVQEETAAMKEAAANDRIQENIAAMYVLQALYVGKLNAIVDEAVAEHNAGASGREVISSKLVTLNALEDECDQQVTAIVDDLQVQLKIAGKDNSLAEEILGYYLSEKNMKKAQLYQQYRAQ